MIETAKVTMPGVVKKIIAFPLTQEPEKAEIAVEGADELYKEIRIENTLETSEGDPVKLTEGAHVTVTVEADPGDTRAAGKN